MKRSESERSSTATDPTRKKPLPEIREDYEHAKTGWMDVRREAATDMAYVSGNPWTAEDEDLRENRPTVAPDEMTQYRNQVTNALRRSPRGMKFQPNGNGASQKTAEFYQDKAREIEYRSDASEAYIGAAENVLQRSYGAFRIGVRYEGSRDINPELYIEGFPDPDVVLPDPAIRRQHGQDMKFCFVLQTIRRSEFKKKYKGAAVTNFGDYVDRYKDWVIGSKLIQIAEHWKVETEKRPLHAVVMRLRDQPDAPARPMPMFQEEIDRARKSEKVRIDAVRHIRDVDYPRVKMRVTNGLEILETLEWAGKFIPIVLLFGPIRYVPTGGETKRQIISMTRPMRDPWKSYCFASSQELEVLGQVPKAAAIAYAGQLGPFEDDWNDSLYTPKAFLYALGRTPGMTETEERLPLPQRMEYAQAEYLQSIEVVKEGFRRAIQAAAGSNFLPTQAQKFNEKSGVALDKIDEAATEGTYHFVKTYESAIRRGGEILEDLVDKVYDQTGDTGVMNAKLEAKSVRINDAQDPEAFSTRGDHLVTVQTMPLSDSEYDAVEKFIEILIGQLGIIAEVAGPPAAAYVLSQSIKMRNLGPMGDDLAEALLPEQFKTKDGKPPDPRLAAAMQKVQQLTQQLQAAEFEIKTGAAKERIRGAIQKEIAELKAQATSSDKDKDRAVKIDVAAIQAKIETMAMILEELERIGGMNSDAAARLHDAGQAAMQRSHERIEGAKDRLHERNTKHLDIAAAKASAAAQAGAETDTQVRQAKIDEGAREQETKNAAALQSMPAPDEGGEQ